MDLKSISTSDTVYASVAITLPHSFQNVLEGVNLGILFSSSLGVDIINNCN